MRNAKVGKRAREGHSGVTDTNTNTNTHTHTNTSTSHNRNHSHKTKNINVNGIGGWMQKSWILDSGVCGASTSDCREHRLMTSGNLIKNPWLCNPTMCGFISRALVKTRALVLRLLD